MAEVTLRVCDMCGANGADTWQVGRKGRAGWVIDLCEPCQEPLTRYQEKARAPQGGVRPYRKYTGKVQVKQK